MRLCPLHKRPDKESTILCHYVALSLDKMTYRYLRALTYLPPSHPNTSVKQVYYKKVHPNR